MTKTSDTPSPEKNQSILCIAADEKFADMASELVASLQQCTSRHKPDLGFLDLGVDWTHRETFRSAFTHIVQPGWDVRMGPDGTEGERRIKGYKAMTARPHLPKHFPGYEAYLWIDADCWVQDGDVIDQLVDGALAGDFVVAPEIDRAYAHMYWSLAFWKWWYREYVRAYSEKAAQGAGRNPVLNSGVFALPGDSPFWQAWSDNLQSAFDRVIDFNFEQLAFNWTFYRDKPPHRFLSSRYNWLANKALPKFDPATRRFVEPMPPFSPLVVMHVCGDAKKRENMVEVLGQTGVTLPSSLRFDPDRKDFSSVART